MEGMSLLRPLKAAFLKPRSACLSHRIPHELFGEKKSSWIQSNNTDVAF